MKVWCGYKDRYINEKDKIENPKTNLYIYGQLMMHKDLYMNIHSIIICNSPKYPLIDE